MKSWFEKSYFYRKKIHPWLAKLPVYDYWMLRRHSYLADNGWFSSFRKGKSIDANGMPVPWFTYSAIRFLKERLPGDLKIFEYGSGNSTLWWSERAKLVHTVEHCSAWRVKLQPYLPAHSKIIFRNPDEGYESAVLTTGESYDVIVLDGRNRDKCLGHSLQVLSKRGIIVFDDSHWQKYQNTIQYLHSLGFRQMPFRGMSPIEFRECETSVFYRENNILGI